MEAGDQAGQADQGQHNGGCPQAKDSLKAVGQRRAWLGNGSGAAPYPGVQHQGKEGQN